MVYYITNMDKNIHSGSPVAAGIDWVTMRYPAEVLPSVARELITDKVNEPRAIPPAYFMREGRQYEGGIRVYGGTQDSHRVMVVDGGTLTRLYKKNALIGGWLGRMIEAGGNVTRLDLCVDLYDEGEQARKELNEWRNGQRREKKRKVKLVFKPEHPELGCTMYEGSRQSDVAGKQYDKNAESNGIFPTTRWEYELKGDTAKALTAELLAAVRAGGVQHIRKVLLGTLLRELNKSALGTTCFAGIALLEKMGITESKIELEDKVSDTERWIIEQVLPTLKRNLADKEDRTSSYYGLICREMEEYIKAL